MQPRNEMKAALAIQITPLTSSARTVWQDCKS
jgi:hypothetical protein